MKLLLTSFALTCIASFNLGAKTLSYAEVKSIAKNVLEERDYGLTDAKLNDITAFCPSYNSLSQDEREDFFAHLIASMARYESSFNAKTTFMENNGNVSAGLLQISLGSINPIYRKNGCSVISSASDLQDPKKNIQCGFGIISTLAKKDGFLADGPSKGASRYWSVLRAPYTVYIKSLKKTVKVGKKFQVIKELNENYSNCR
jgi:hypothetical protein